MTPLKRFQQDAVDNAVDLFTETIKLIEDATTLSAKKAIIQYNGALLVTH